MAQLHVWFLVTCLLLACSENPPGEVDLRANQELRVTPTVASTSEDTPVEGKLAVTATDLTVLSYATIKAPLNGKFEWVDEQKALFRYTPKQDFFGNDFAQIKVSNGSSNVVASLTVSVEAVNDLPTAKDGSIVVDVPGEKEGTLLGSDLEVGPLTFSIVAQGTKGVATITDDATGAFRYVANATASGTDEFTFKVNDGDKDSVPATIKVTFNTAANDPPVADAQSVSTAQGAPLDGHLTGTDPEGEELTFFRASDAGKGSVVVQENGDFTYTPRAGEVGADSFKFIVKAGGVSSEEATVSITINAAVNEPPVADPATFPGITGQLTGRDPEGAPVTFHRVANGDKGTVVIASDGEFTYTPNAGATGTAKFKFKVRDGVLDSAEAEATVTIPSAPNQPPVANEQVVTTTPSTPFNGQLTGSDPEGSPLTFELTTEPTNGSVQLINSNTGTYRYTPQANAGSDSFKFRVKDGVSFSPEVAVSIAILSAPNNPPVANPASFSTNQGVALSRQLTGSDPENSPLTFELASVALKGDVILQNNGAVTYTPHAGKSGADSFKFKVKDGNLQYSPEATVSITINAPANLAPVAYRQTFPINQGAILNGQLTGNDPEGLPLTFHLVTTNPATPAKGSVELLNSNTGTFKYTPQASATGTDSFRFKVKDGSLFSPEVVITISIDGKPIAQNKPFSTGKNVPLTVAALPGSDPESEALVYSIVTPPAQGTISGFAAATGAFTYTPVNNFVGTVSFTFRVKAGTQFSATATVTITVIETKPTATNGVFSFNEDVTTGLQLEGSGPPGATLKYTITQFPSKGRLFETNVLGKFNYVPFPDIYGTDSFRFKVVNGQEESAVATAEVTIKPVNDPPVARYEAVMAKPGNRFYWKCLVTNPDGGSLTYAVVTPPGKGTLTLESTTGRYTYTPNATAQISDVFKFSVTDGTTSSSHTVFINLLPTWDGMANTSFGGDGLIDVPGYYEIKKVFPLSTGGLFAVLQRGPLIVLRKFLANGNVDTSYGTDGSIPLQFLPTLRPIAYDQFIARWENGIMYVVAHETSGTVAEPARLFIGYYNAQGRLDTSFGTGGVVSFNSPEGTSMRAGTVVVDSSFNLYPFYSNKPEGTARSITKAAHVSAQGQILKQVTVNDAWITEGVALSNGELALSGVRYPSTVTTQFTSAATFRWRPSAGLGIERILGPSPTAVNGSGTFIAQKMLGTSGAVFGGMQDGLVVFRGELENRTLNSAYSAAQTLLRNTVTSLVPAGYTFVSSLIREIRVVGENTLVSLRIDSKDTSGAAATDNFLLKLDRDLRLDADFGRDGSLRRLPASYETKLDGTAIYFVDGTRIREHRLH